ncbi:MAG: outer membrane beta-barrel protein [Proteobacteria bacterium]|nr:outer membrane beta-barrel protein [Pseudomonadota bacterium]
MRRVFCGLTVLTLAGVANVANAQYGYSNDYAYGRGPVQWHIMGGAALTTGHTADYLETGYTIGGGLTFRPAPMSLFSLRADLSFSRFNATNRLLNIGAEQNQTEIDDGWGDIVNLDVDGVLDIPLGARVRGYVMAGVGGAYRRIDLTQTVGFGGYFCDDWYGYCGIGVVPGDVLVQREETTRFAWNAGVGVEFPLDRGQSFFVEARYSRMETPNPTEFIPIRIGYRF